MVPAFRDSWQIKAGSHQPLEAEGLDLIVETAMAKESPLGACRFRTHHIVFLNHRGNAHWRSAVLDTRLDTEDSTECVHQNLFTVRYCRWQGQHQIELGASLRILIHYKVQSARRDVAGIALPGS